MYACGGGCAVECHGCECVSVSVVNGCVDESLCERACGLPGRTETRYSREPSLRLEVFQDPEVGSLQFGVRSLGRIENDSPMVSQFSLVKVPQTEN